MNDQKFRIPWVEFFSLSHALVVTGIWILIFEADLDVMPGKVWMVLALSWLLWTIAIALSRKEDRVRRMIAVAIGAIVLTPTIPTLYTFVVWTIEGFAP